MSLEDSNPRSLEFLLSDEQLEKRITAMRKTHLFKFIAIKIQKNREAAQGIAYNINNLLKFRGVFRNLDSLSRSKQETIIHLKKDAD
jgi:hypothetical protein